MTNLISMSNEFERRKNVQALTVTGAIAGALLLIFIFVSWKLPEKPVPPPDDYVEVELPDEPPYEDLNLGNNDVGSGKIQPIVTGTPSSQPVSNEVAPSKGENVQQATKDLEPEEHSNGAVVAKPTKPNPTAKEVNSNTEDQTVKAPTPTLRKGAQMTSARGSGNGGNTDLPGYNRPGSQGPGDGPGDKGVQNGNPNGRKYLGTNVSNIKIDDFADDFNESGTIALDIEVDENGKLVKSTYQLSQSTLPKSSRQYTIAQDRVRKIDFPKMEGGFKMTRLFKFKVS